MEKQKLNIVILTDQLHKIGGINSLINIKANYWSTVKKHKVDVVTTEQEGKATFYPFTEQISLYDLGILYDRNSSYFGKNNIVKVFKNYRKLKKLLKNLNPDLVIIANHIPVTFFFPFLNSKAKFLKEYHFTQFYRSKVKLTPLIRFEKLIERKLDFKVVLNEEEKGFYNSGRIVHIPNPIPHSFIEKPSFSIETREKTAIAAGRFSPVKRFDLLLEIWNEFKKSDNEWNLEIYGDGTDIDVAELNSLITKYHLKDSVRLIKPVDNLMEIMQKKGLYLMTSIQECFPMVLLESQSSGLPIIAFDCPTGPRNIIEKDKTGCLIEMDNKVMFINKLLELTHEDNKREELARNGFESVQKYLLDPVMKQWDQKILNHL
ncbi:glycosyltransferase [Muricauda sp. HICW]|uniref:Glycosyltransferase n=1 Tax=Flagellimonas chongwuensis TaxID=2697365 RepID=A0A850NHQ8_9FLAO|nr:glycosyltransferase [Allomuricauda chongwuensis]NVN19319.1 glycosyltransferase [Allomuricauda chongwuensis]